MTPAPHGHPTDAQQPDDGCEPEPTRPRREFEPQTQALIRHLITSGDLTAVIQHGEPCTRLSSTLRRGSRPVQVETSSSIP